VVLAVPIGGCGDAGDDGTAPGADEPPPTAAPKPPRPSFPASAAQRDASGAAALVTYWLEAANHADATGNVKPFEEASHPACLRCEVFTDEIELIYGAGGSVRGGDRGLRGVETVGFSVEASPSVVLHFDQSARELVGSTGKTARRTEAASFEEATIRLVWSGRTWLVADVEGPDMLS
jgi:Family of unknown function (DUF6318)